MATLARNLARGAVLLACLIALTGCYRSAVRGLIVDNQRQPLPGVAVTVTGNGFQAVSDVRGHYEVRFNPGRVRLDFMKTGYAPARLELTAKPFKFIKADTVRMWRLPPDKGVYLLQGGNYVPTNSTQPIEYQAQNKPLYGSEDMQIDAITASPHPKLVCYRLPALGAKLVRLEWREAVRPNTAGESRVVWAAGESVPVRESPLDAPDGLLLELKYKTPLTSGTYAVHWGALEGKAQPEPLMYMFTVNVPGEKLPPRPPQSPAATGTPSTGKTSGREAPKKSRVKSGRNAGPRVSKPGKKAATGPASEKPEKSKSATKPAKAKKAPPMLRDLNLNNLR